MNRRNRALTVAALAIVVVLAWTYLLFGAGIGMEEMDLGGGQMMLTLPELSLGHGLVVFAMWIVMMIAMMLPGETRVILTAATLGSEQRPSVVTLRHTSNFVAGYLVVWFGFSLVATVAQWSLDGAGLLSDTRAMSGPMLTGSLLVYAGVYQWSPLKQACLTHCRAPEDFLARHWRRAGPFGTGLQHGLFCLGCCWMLMLLLFVGGVMNLACIAAIAVAILVEKTLPRGVWVSWVIGSTLIAGGVITLAAQRIA